MEAAAKQALGSKVEITVDATGRQNMSPPRAPENRDKVSRSEGVMHVAACGNAVR
jgi:hypothetical protein